MRRPGKFSTASILLALGALICGLLLITSGTALAGMDEAPPPYAGPKNYVHDKPFEAPAYVPPPPPPPKTQFTDNGDGTLTNKDGLMWAQKDSYADLGKCLNWWQSAQYVKELKTGGYTDWRMPDIWEIFSIYDDTKSNVLAWDEDPTQPLHLDKQFARGAAYWYWVSDMQETDLTDCCAYSYYFVKGFSNVRRFSYCTNGGVRAVRDTK